MQRNYVREARIVQRVLFVLVGVVAVIATRVRPAVGVGVALVGVAAIAVWSSRERKSWRWLAQRLPAELCEDVLNGRSDPRSWDDETRAVVEELEARRRRRYALLAARGERLTKWLGLGVLAAGLVGIGVLVWSSRSQVDDTEVLDGADLSGRDLREKHLSGATLSGVNLSGASLAEMRLERATFQTSNLDAANLARANLANAIFYHSTLRGTDATHAVLEYVKLERCDATGAKLEGAVAPNAKLVATILDDARLFGASLSGATFVETRAERADFSNADLRETSWFASSLRLANLSGAHLEGAHLDRVDLTGADLRGAALENTRFDRVCYDDDTSFGEGFDPSAKGLRRLDEGQRCEPLARPAIGTSR